MRSGLIGFCETWRDFDYDTELSEKEIFMTSMTRGERLLAVKIGL